MGNVYKNPEQPLKPKAFELNCFITVGGYAIQPVWADGHNTGIYSFRVSAPAGVRKIKRRAPGNTPFVIRSKLTGESARGRILSNRRCCRQIPCSLPVPVMMALVVQLPGNRLAELKMAYCLPLTVGQ